MKKLLIPLCFLAFCLNAQVYPRIGYNGQLIGSVIGATGLTPPASYLIRQGFEGTGYDNSETWTEIVSTGTVDEDNTDFTLSGSQCLFLYATNGAAAQTYASFTPALSEAWVFFKLRLGTNDTSSTARIIFALGESSVSTKRFTILLADSTGSKRLRVGHGTPTATCTANLPEGTVIYVWGRYKKSTATNGEAEVWWSTTGTKPDNSDTAYYASITAGTSTTDVARAIIGDNSTVITHAHYFDDVTVDDVEIGNQ